MEDRTMEEEARQNAIVRQTDIQNSLISDVESDIHIVKHKIDDMKEEYRQFDDDYGFTDRLEELYGELGSLISKRDAMKHFAFNEPLQTNTSHRNPSWVVSETNSDPNFAVGYEVDYDAQLDKLNKDL
tara:strand:+ start:495 stop:878 length:384 start_codon:yes stop_codon:yes gene_type:complete